ncbi:HPr family phosphocarrier protein [Pseudogracilibacillus sp. SO30301A]|uniref:HPr family phosphocarrier protein n=1 Tax=Pseudogracilibacillus sp. SO30301A TaxID=3098291 RepID=UPI00300E1802
MVEKSVEVLLESGLQARPAAQFVQEANRFTADLFLEKEGKRINAKSIMGLMSLAITKGETVRLIADGPDEEVALNELVSFISTNS